VNEDLTSKLKKITAPSLLVWGARDRDTPMYMARAMKKRIKNSGLVIFPEAGHYSYLDNYYHFLTILDNFFKNEE
jgi:pimeloyl-ACP methyl ester carboxylesterase